MRTHYLRKAILMKKRSKTDEKKDPLHIEYGLMSNMKWVFSAIVRYDRGILFSVFLGIVCAPFMNYLWTFISKFIIDMITGNGEPSELLVMMLIFTGIQTAATMLNSLYSYEWYRFIFVRFKLMLEKNVKVMSVDFPCLEDPDLMDCYQKASEACGGNDQGVEGLMRHSFSFLQSLVVTAVGMIILGTLNVWIMIGIAALAAVNFAVRNFANKWGKAHVWDPLAKWWRKSEYMKQEVTDFKFAKEVRLFGLKDWLTEKYAALQKERYDAQVKNEKVWFVVALTSTLITQGVQLFV